MENNNNMISNILIIGVVGIVGYFIYEKYIKKSDSLSTNSTLAQSGLLNNAGVQRDNNVFTSPLLYTSLSPNSSANTASPNSLANTASPNSLANTAIYSNFNAMSFMGDLNHKITSSIENALGITWHWEL